MNVFVPLSGMGPDASQDRARGSARIHAVSVAIQRILNR